MTKLTTNLVTLAAVAVLVPLMAYVFVDLCEPRSVWLWRDMLGLGWGLHCR